MSDDQYGRSLPPARHRAQGYGQAPPPPPGPPAVRYSEQPAPRDRGYAVAVRRGALTAAAHFWYIVGNIPLFAMYFAKVPAKRAMADAGLCELTGFEAFWYVLMCIPFGAGYFAKIPVAKALAELPR